MRSLLTFRPVVLALVLPCVVAGASGCSGMFQSGPMKLEVAGGKAAVSGPGGLEVGGSVGGAAQAQADTEETCARDGVVVPCEKPKAP
jgi:hypothetical protein